MKKVIKIQIEPFSREFAELRMKSYQTDNADEWSEELDKSSEHLAIRLNGSLIGAGRISLIGNFDFEAVSKGKFSGEGLSGYILSRACKRKDGTKVSNVVYSLLVSHAQQLSNIRISQLCGLATNETQKLLREAEWETVGDKFVYTLPDGDEMVTPMIWRNSSVIGISAIEKRAKNALSALGFSLETDAELNLIGSK